MIRHQQSGVTFYTYQQFDSFSNVYNLISTRLGGVSEAHLHSLNLSFSELVGDDPNNVIVNRSRFYDVIKLDPSHVAQAELVHKNRVALVDEYTPRGTFNKLPATDGLVTNVARIALFIPVADCAVLTFYDPIARVIAAVHAGWKGTVAGIIPETMHKMSALGSNPSDILVGISPVLEKCCYQVKADLVQSVTEAFPNHAQTFFEPSGDDVHFEFDFLGLLCWQLQESGISHEHIEPSGMCTACNVNMFYSHRAEHGRTGRFAGLIIMQ